MKTTFKVIRIHKNGQQSSLFMESKTIKTVRGLLQHRRETIIKLMGFQSGDSITAEIVELQEEKEDYWETRKKAEELRRMSGDDSILGNPSY